MPPLTLELGYSIIRYLVLSFSILCLLGRHGACACNPCTQEAKAGGLPVGGQPALYLERPSLQKLRMLLLRGRPCELSGVRTASGGRTSDHTFTGCLKYFSCACAGGSVCVSWPRCAVSSLLACGFPGQAWQQVPAVPEPPL